MTHDTRCVPDWEAFNAIPCVELKHFSLNLYMKSVQGPASLTPVSRLLSHFPRTVTAIELTINESRRKIQSLDALGWEGLQAQLLRFDQLRSITLDRYPQQPQGKELLLQAAKRCMPTLAERKLLYITHAPVSRI